MLNKRRQTPLSTFPQATCSPSSTLSQGDCNRDRIIGLGKLVIYYCELAVRQDIIRNINKRVVDRHLLQDIYAIADWTNVLPLSNTVSEARRWETESKCIRSRGRKPSRQAALLLAFILPNRYWREMATYCYKHCSVHCADVVISSLALRDVETWQGFGQCCNLPRWQPWHPSSFDGPRGRGDLQRWVSL